MSTDRFNHHTKSPPAPPKDRLRGTTRRAHQENDLLSQIQKGTKLNKNVNINDRSAPLVERCNEGLTTQAIATHTKMRTAPQPEISNNNYPTQRGIDNNFLLNLTSKLNERAGSKSASMSRSVPPLRETQDFTLNSRLKSPVNSQSIPIRTEVPNNHPQIPDKSNLNPIKSVKTKDIEIPSIKPPQNLTPVKTRLDSASNSMRNSKESINLTELSRIASQKPPPPKPIPNSIKLPKRTPDPTSPQLISQIPKEPPLRVPPPPPPTTLFTDEDLKFNIRPSTTKITRPAILTEQTNQTPLRSCTLSFPSQPPSNHLPPHSQLSYNSNSTLPLIKKTPELIYDNSKQNLTPASLSVTFGRWTFIENLPPPRSLKKSFRS